LRVAGWVTLVDVRGKRYQELQADPEDDDPRWVEKGAPPPATNPGGGCGA
jgi:hypothetical protein